MKWLGKDGKWYDDVNDCVAADNRYRQQEQQNDLISEQNQLMKMQIRNQEMADLRREKAELEREGHERQLAKEKRINKLFDDIGISRKEFMEFEQKYLFRYDLSDLRSEQYEIEEEINKLKNIVNIPSKLISRITKDNKLTFRDIAILNKSGITDEFTIYRLIRGWCYTWGVFIPIMLLIVLTSGGIENATAAVTIFVLLFAPMLPVFAHRKFKDKAISKLKEYNGKALKASKQIKALEEKLSSVNKNIDDKDKEDTETMINNLNEFTTFRRSHYNKDFEKLLLDLDIDETYREYEVDFTKVNSNNKINDGTIEDYIAFIQQKID